MTIQQIYTQYTIPPHLQKHMLRVAALAEIMAENWKGEGIDKHRVVLAAAFHDMANIIKFKLDKPALFKEESDKQSYWREVQLKTIQKYGADVNKATLMMCREFGLPKDVIAVIKKIEWSDTKRILAQQDFTTALPLYADMRMGPHGILPLEKRIQDLENRYKITEEYINSLQKSATLMERSLQSRISINITEITEDQLNRRFKSLQKLDV